MSNELKDYGQLFCEAVDTIVKERLSGIKFDSTILCTIVDDKDKAQGKYIVSYSDAKFEAYAMGETKYNKNNNVYVQIPGGDWNEQKFIIAKKTNEEDTPVTYQYPFDSFVDITGNIIKNTPQVEGSLIANGYWDKSDPDDIQVLAGEDEQLIWAYNITGDNVVNYEEGEKFSKYTRLGIQAQFQSWLAEDNAVSGSYGLRLRVEAEKADLEDIETDEEYEEPETEVVYYDFVLDSADMVGNPYAFDTYFQQEKLFDITDIYRINKMQLQFYQKGDFKQSSGEVFPTYEDENLFVKDVYISLGYDAKEFENDTVSIYSFGSPSYNTKADPGELNHRELNVRWIHRMSNDIIKAVDEEDDINYTITWYKYRLGAYSHTPQSGADWTPLSEQIVEWKTDELGKRVKTVTLNILDEDWQNYNLTAEAGYVRELEFNKSWLIPDITLAEESIKVIVSYKVGSQQIYVYSDPLTFKNRQEVVSKPTVDAVSALSIVCEDGTFGNYRIYNQGNELINPAEGATERVFKAYFKGAPLTNAESIEWIIPTENSMIVLENNYYAPDRTWDDAGRISMKRYGDKSKRWDISQSNDQRYKIKRYYAQQYASNTIQCKVVKDKITYTAVKELTFGPAGTSGSDYTLILDFDDGFTAIPFLGTEFLKDGKPDEDKVKTALVQESYGITARLYDFENKEINFENDVSNFTIEWDFYTAPTEKALTLSSGWKTIREVDEEDPTKEIITKIDDETGCKQRLNVDYSKLDINTLYIIRAMLKWRGEQPIEDTGITPQVLTAYLSIPIYRYLKDTRSVIDETTNEEIAELIIQPSFIGGAKQVIYMSNGLPNYYKNAYQIFYNEYNELEDKTLFVESTKEWNENIAWNLIGYPNLDDYSPECDKENGNSLSDQHNKLKPCGIYIKDANHYGVQCKRKIKDSEEFEVIWTQPIFVTMNRYPNSMINKWDGKTLEIDKEKGSILATAIAAGKKETWINNNDEQQTAFTGVMLGDWSTSTLGDLEESVIKTGIYGFHRGEQSFAFTEDGKAFIGKSGRGRIYLDGEDSVIKSMAWDLNPSQPMGMFLDIDDGILKLNRDNKFITLSADEKTYPLSIGTSSSVSSRDFRVTWDGKLYAENADIEGTIWGSTIKGGTIKGSYIEGAEIFGAEIEGGSIVTGELFAGLAAGYIYYVDKKVNGSWQATGGVMTFAKDEGSVFYDHEVESKASTRYRFKEKITETKKVARLGSFTGGINVKVEDGVDANGNLKFKDELIETAVVGLSTFKQHGTTVEDIPIVITSKARLALFSEANIMMKGTMFHFWYNGAGDNGIFRIDGVKPENQYGIYARFA